MQIGRRPLRRWERALVYGVVGVASEVAFTGARGSVLRRSWKLEGHSYLWMLPIYGLSAFLFEPAHEAVRSKVWWQRAAVYSVGIMGVEYGVGMGLRRGVGLVPWDYSEHSRWSLPGGATRLDYAPLWGVAGLALERVHDVLRDVTVGTS
jgi:hypothetical protein